MLEDPVGGTEVGGVVPEGEIPPEDPPEVSLLTEFSALVAGLAETWVITESIGASLNSRRPMESRDIPGFTSENLKLSSLQKSRQIYKLHDFISGLFSMQNVFSRVFGKTKFSFTTSTDYFYFCSATHCTTHQSAAAQRLTVLLKGCGYKVVKLFQNTPNSKFLLSIIYFLKLCPIFVSSTLCLLKKRLR